MVRLRCRGAGEQRGERGGEPRLLEVGGTAWACSMRARAARSVHGHGARAAASVSCGLRCGCEREQRGKGERGGPAWSSHGDATPQPHARHGAAVRELCPLPGSISSLTKMSMPGVRKEVREARVIEWRHPLVRLHMNSLNSVRNLVDLG